MLSFFQLLPGSLVKWNSRRLWGSRGRQKFLNISLRSISVISIFCRENIVVLKLLEDRVVIFGTNVVVSSNKQLDFVKFWESFVERCNHCNNRFQIVIKEVAIMEGNIINDYWVVE